LKKNDKVSTEKTYYSCLDIYESSTYDVDQRQEETVYSNYARKPGSLLLTRYTILKVLKENTFGFIYLVERINKNTKYIIKEFFPHEFVRRNDKEDMILNTPLDIESLIRFNYLQNFFIGEANSLEKISIKPHDNIIKIASVEKNQNNTTYIIYPHNEGMTFHRYMEIKARMGKDQLDSKGLDKILKPLLQAVKHLHTLGIYHLNIKPENILIKEDGDLLLLGFESSTFFNDDDSRVFCNAYTLACAAPEQIHAKGASRIGPESDIYGIGVLLYKMVTGRYPPDAKERIACIEKEIKYDPYVFLQEKEELLEKYNPSLLLAIDKAMMLSKNDRFKDIKSFENTLFNIDIIPEPSVITNKKNLLLYSVLLLASIYIIFEWVGKIESDEKVVAIPSHEEILIDKQTTVHTVIKEENIDDVSENLDKDEDVESTKKIDEKHLEKVEDILADTKVTSVEKAQDIIVQEEIDTAYVKEIQVDINDSYVDTLKKKDIENKEITEKTILKIEKPKIINIDENKIPLIEMKKNIKIKEVKLNTVLKTDKTVQQTTKKILKQRKKRVIRKKKITKKKHIQIKKNTSAKTSSGLVWYCKAIGGNVRASARNSDKSRSKNIALEQCRRKAGSQKNCRILNCFLLR
jgi:serine/threonine protein kinase